MTQDAEKLAEVVALRVVEILLKRGMLRAWVDPAKVSASSGRTDIDADGGLNLSDRAARENWSALIRKQKQKKESQLTEDSSQED